MAADRRVTGGVTVLEVDTDAIAENWRMLAARHPGGAVAGVVKADAYGLGVDVVVPALLAAGCRYFFTAHPDEALAVRGLAPDAVVGVLNGLWPGAAADYRAARLSPAIGSLGELDAWRAGAGDDTTPAFLHVDTGMHRLGMPADEVDVLAGDPARLAGMPIAAVMTHLVSAELPDDPINDVQRRRFAAACDRLPPAPRSLANSSGLFLGDGFASDLARPGAALYGINPTPGRPNPMRPVVRLLARVLQVRDVPAGEGVGYNGTWRAPRPSRIATVSVGYADGFFRVLTNVAEARFDGRPVPLVGRVSMDLSTFDVTGRPEIGPGSWLELIGPDMPPDEVARRAGTNGYEVLTSLGRRYARGVRIA